MMTAFIGLALNKVKDNLRLILGVVMVLMFLAIVYYRAAYKDAQQEYTDHLIQDKVAVKMAAITNGIIERNSNNAVALEVKKHKDTIARLQVNETELKQKVGDLYAVKTNADFRLASYRDLQLLHANSDNSPSAEPASDTERLTSCRRQLDATDTRLSVVEEACAVTTADFNLARGWIDGVCANHKCTDEVTK